MIEPDDIAGRRRTRHGRECASTCWRSRASARSSPACVALDNVQFSLQARHRACADGRERRRQVDADEDHRRHLPPRSRARSACAARRSARLAARRARERHRHDPSGTQPDAVHDGGREHLDPARAEEPLRLRRSRRACAARPQSCSSGSTSRSIPKSRCATCRVANRQMVEIAKAVSYDSDVLIMDEPTSALTETRGRASLRRSSATSRAGQRHRLHHPQDERAVRDRRRVLGVPRRQVHRHPRRRRT